MAKAEPGSIVLVVDDDLSVRRSLTRLLSSAGYTVEAFASARDFLDRARSQDVCGCVVLDIRMPGLSGLDLQHELKALTPALPIVFISGHSDVPTSVRAMKAGAVDFLTKPVDAKDLLSVVARAVKWNLEARTRYAELRELRRRAETLTPREREVMKLVVQGRLNKQAAAELGTVEKTIKVHRARVIQKMGVESLAELVRVAEKLEMFPTETGPGAPRATTAVRPPVVSKDS
jgi:FixJ family two-component response regulator